MTTALRLLVCLLALAAGMAHAATPRLWKASRGNTTLYVLAALRASATLSVEGVDDGEEGPATPGCDLRPLDVKALAKAPDPDTQAQSWARLIEMSDEFTLL